jgi:hypothetical protein
MDNATRKLLESYHPEDRKKGIQLLTRTPKLADLSFLAELYRSDNNEEVRDEAMRAAQYIQQIYEEEKVPQHSQTEQPKRTFTFTPFAEKRSKEMLDRAMSFWVKDNDENQEKARQLAQKAYEVNPHIADDPYYSGILAQIFNLDKLSIETYLASLVNQEKSKPQNTENQVSFGTAFTDLIIYGLVVAISTLVMFAILISIARPTLDQFYTQTIATNPRLNNVSNPFNLTLNSASILSLMIGAVGGGLIAAIILGLYNGLLHFIAHYLLNGNGTWSILTHKTINLSIINQVIGLILAVLTFLVVSDILITMNSLVENSVLASQVIQNTSVLNMVSTAYSFIILYVFCTQVSKSYDFSAGKGCLAVILSAVIPIGILFGFVFTVFFAT